MLHVSWFFLPVFGAIFEYKLDIFVFIFIFSCASSLLFFNFRHLLHSYTVLTFGNITYVQCTDADM